MSGSDTRVVRLPHGFRPRSYQRGVWRALDSGIRRMIQVDHRRAGKDVNLLNLTIAQTQIRTGIYFHVLPTYNQGRKVIWEGIGKAGNRYLDFIPDTLVASKNESEMKIRFVNGSVWQVVGAENQKSIDRLVGSNPVGIVFSEYALMSPSVWDLLRPVLAENEGWAAFVYTPRGKNHAFDLYQMAKDNPAWYVALHTVDDTFRDAEGEDGSPVVTKEDVEEERRAGMPEELIQQEFYCSFSAGMVGSYYANLVEAAEKDGRVSNVPWDPNLPVYTCWDLGVDDSTAIAFFQAPPGRRAFYFIDCLEQSGEGAEYYARALLQGKPYTYAAHILPFDVENTDWSTGRTRLQALRGLGLRNIQVAPRASVGDGIDAVRRVLPTCYFDKVKCKQLVESLRAYRKEWDEERRVFKDKPLHDWSSHFADAFRYFATGFRPVGGHQAPRTATMSFDPMTLEERVRALNAKTDFDPMGGG